MNGALDDAVQIVTRRIEHQDLHQEASSGLQEAGSAFISMGFCVAMTRKGASNSCWVAAGDVRSCMVRAEPTRFGSARLISSASTRLARSVPVEIESFSARSSVNDMLPTMSRA